MRKLLVALALVGSACATPSPQIYGTHSIALSDPSAESSEAEVSGHLVLAEDPISFFDLQRTYPDDILWIQPDLRAANGCLITSSRSGSADERFTLLRWRVNADSTAVLMEGYLGSLVTELELSGTELGSRARLDIGDADWEWWVSLTAERTGPASSTTCRSAAERTMRRALEQYGPP